VPAIVSVLHASLLPCGPSEFNHNVIDSGQLIATEQ